MASSWGNPIGHWRCGVNAWVSSTTDEAATVSVEVMWQAMGYGFQVGYNSAWAGCDGQSSGEEGAIRVESGYGEWVETLVLSRAFTVARGDSARAVRCSASFSMPDFEAGSSFASMDVEVPAREVDVPAAPADVRLSRESDSRLLGSWAMGATADAPWASVEAQFSRDGGEWGAGSGASQAISPAAASTSYELAVANAAYRMRVRSTNQAGASAWVESGTVKTTPAAPGALSAAFSGGRVSLTWRRDAASPDSAVIQRSADGMTWAEAATLGAEATSWADAAPPAGSAWYRVAYVAGGLTGPWATTGPVSTYTSADYPTVEVTGPASPLRSLPLTATWEVGGPDPVASQRAVLVSGGSVLEAAEPGSSVRSWLFRGDGLADGATATVMVSVTDSKGLSTTGAREVVADYWPPAEPTAAVSYDAVALTATLALGSAAGANRSEASSVDVYRVLADGSEAVVELGAAPGSAVVDATPPIGAAYSYRLVAHSAGGKAATASVSALLDARVGAVTFRDGTTVSLPYCWTLDEDVETGGESFQFADGGLPLFYPDGTRSRRWTVKFALLAEAGEALSAAASADPHGTVVVRDARGRRLFGHPSWGLSTPVGGGWREVSATIDETEDAW